MNITTIILIVLLVLGLIGSAAGVYIYLRNKTLEEVRLEVYKLFLAAERSFKESKSGQQKMKYVISQARGLLPGWLQLFITEALLEKIIQEWFSAIKDLLDDGKYNKSVSRKAKTEAK